MGTAVDNDDDEIGWELVVALVLGTATADFAVVVSPAPATEICGTDAGAGASEATGLEEAAVVAAGVAASLETCAAVTPPTGAAEDVEDVAFVVDDSDGRPCEMDCCF